MSLVVEPIGYVQTDAEQVPHYWDVSEVEGQLVIEERYRAGLEGLSPGQRIFVIFHFDRSPPFVLEQIRQQPRCGDHRKGVFAISSPIRPNPLGLSVLQILSIEGHCLRVRGLDMLDGTPILDIKPYPRDRESVREPG
jgi:tRNA-Thr(GGU) m(6)t(6)A37 methyltransferase TsaA